MYIWVPGYTLSSPTKSQVATQSHCPLPSSYGKERAPTLKSCAISLWKRRRMPRKEEEKKMSTPELNSIPATLQMEPLSLSLRQARYHGDSGNIPEHLPMGVWRRETHCGWSKLCLWSPPCPGLFQSLPTRPWINPSAPSPIDLQLAQFKQFFCVRILITLFIFLLRQFLVIWKLCKPFVSISFESATQLGTWFPVHPESTEVGKP